MKRFLQFSIISMCISLSPVSLLFAGNVDTTWINHYLPGQLPGKIKIMDMAVDDQGNSYIVGTVRNMFSSDDFITIKYGSDGSEKWRALYDGPASEIDMASAIAVDATGNVYVTGTSTGKSSGVDYATIKYSPGGMEQWVVRYSGPGYEINADYAEDIALDDSGNVIVTGGSDSNTSGDILTIKYDNAGIEKWSARYNGPAGDGEDSGYYLAIDDSGNVIVVGRSDNSNGRDDYAVLKYSPGGEELWVARYDGPDSVTDQPHAVALDDSGNVYITGGSTNANYKWNYATVKYNAAGVEQWSRRYSSSAGANESANGIAVGDSGFVYVTGTGYDSESGNDFLTIKYSSAGEEIWTSRYNGSINGSDEASVIALDSGGNVYISGRSEGIALVKLTPGGEQVWSANNLDIFQVSMIALDPDENIFIAGNHYSDGATIKFDGSGNQIWTVGEQGPGLSFEQPARMIFDPEGNVVLAGISKRVDTETDYSLAKYHPDGTLLWDTVINGPDSSGEYLTAFTGDDAGNIYMTGYTTRSGSGYDWFTVKCNSDGQIQWQVLFDGAGNYYDQANDLVVDHLGNVYVTGNSAKTKTPGDMDITTVKYNSLGEELWSVLYDGPSQKVDDAKAITVDDSGNVYVTGYSNVLTGVYDYTTIKYNTLGEEQWVANYDGPGNSSDLASHIALDGLGNIIVTGASTGDGTGFDYATVQYSPSGIEQWVQRYDGPAGKTDMPADLAVTDEGDVYVTGYETGSYNEENYYTVKYDIAGAFQWDSDYDGPTNQDDKAIALSIGARGNIYVTGTSGVLNGRDEFATVRINPEGYREWAVRYSSGFDKAVDVLSDGQGHIYVTGYSFHSYDSEMVSTLIKYTDPSILADIHRIDEIPGKFQLHQNYPNPFNPSTVIIFELPAAGEMDLSVFNMLGQKITTLVSGWKAAGIYEINWNAKGFSSGMYFYKLETPANVIVQKMLLLK